MRVPKLRLAALALVSGITLGGCAYDNYGGYGGYGGYPYSGVSVGVGYGGGYGGNYGYGGGYGGGYGYGGYASPFGWYDNFYYPGSGIYVYDSYRRPHVWNDRQQRYWSHHGGRNNSGSGTWHGHNGGTWTNNSQQQNWSGFNHSDSGITIRGTKNYDPRNDRR